MVISELGGGYDDTVKFIKGKWQRVLMPYIIVGAFLCLLQHRNIGQMLNGISHLWFLLTIFECYLFGRVVEPVLHMTEHKRQCLIAILILFIILAPYRLPSIRFLSLSQFVSYFPFYLIGMLASKVNFGIFAKYKSKMLTLIILLVLLFALQQVYIKRGLITVFFGISLVSMMFAYARLLNIPELPSWLISLDKCSMGIYIVHHIIIQELITMGVFRSLATDYYHIFPCVLFIVVTMTSWMITWATKKNRYSKYILG